MRAYKLVQFGEPLKLVDAPIPEPSDVEILIKLKASGICHSDLYVKNGTRKTRLPKVLGHECSGIVEETGKGVSDLSIGDRVSVWYVVPCNKCETCFKGMQNACPNRRSLGLDLDGGFAEYAMVPAANALRLPSEVSFEIGAIIGCAVTTAYHAIRVSRVDAGDSIVIYGLGGVGLHMAKIAKILGADRVIGIDTNPTKEGIARDFGVDYFVNPKTTRPADVVRDLTEGEGVDIAFECIGNPRTYEEAMYLVKPGGTIGMVGLCTGRVSFQPFRLLLREAKIAFAVNHTRGEQKLVIDMVENGVLDLSKSVTHTLALDQVEQGFEILARQEGSLVKIVLTQ